MSQEFVEIDGKRLALSNLDKELYPSFGFTKGQVLEYYRRIAGSILPHLQGRALTLKRYPQGVNGEFFFEKRCPTHRPNWVQTTGISRAGGEQMTVCLVNDLETLLWVANLASLELHVPLARAGSPETPDALVFDLDPGEPANICDCAQVALLLREILSRLGLACWVKTSGLKGLHVFVPLNRAESTFVETKQFTRTLAIMLEKTYPELVTAKMAKESRKGKVFINWSQNDSSLTMVSVYSLRARQKPVVSFPLAWDELERLKAGVDPEKFQIIPTEALHRVEKAGDSFSELQTVKQKLPYL